MLRNEIPHESCPSSIYVIEVLAQESRHGTGPPTSRCHVRAGGSVVPQLLSLM